MPPGPTLRSGCRASLQRASKRPRGIKTAVRIGPCKRGSGWQGGGATTAVAKDLPAATRGAAVARAEVVEHEDAAEAAAVAAAAAAGAAQARQSEDEEEEEAGAAAKSAAEVAAAFEASAAAKEPVGKDNGGAADKKKRKKTVAEKIQEWRQRDFFWLQAGALTPLLSGKCLDSGSGQWHGQLKMWGCHKKEVGPNQKFSLTADGSIKQPPPPRKKNAPSRCLATKSRPNLVVTEPCAMGATNQKWDFEQTLALHKVYGRIRSRDTGACLTKYPIGRNQTNNRTVIMEPCSNGCNQTWSFGDRPKDWPNEMTQYRTRKPPRSAGRLLCWILTFPAAADSKALGVNNTWGRRCDILLYMSTEHVEGLNTVKLTLWGPEGRDKLWTKSKLSWLHIYEHYRDKADWFIKADDDTYLSTDNLHAFLSKYDTNELHHFGRKFTVYKDSYYSGGSGIILSKGALLKVGTSFKDAEDPGWSGAPRGTGPEDLLTSKSLKPLGIMAVEALDDEGRQLFMPMGIDHEYFAKERHENAWFYRYSKTAVVGPKCCSPNWVSIHYTATPKMYSIDALEELRCDMSMHEWPHLELGPAGSDESIRHISASPNQ